MESMNTAAVVPLVFKGKELRIITLNGEPWWLASDVCDILGYSNGRDAIKRHCREGGVAKHDTPTTSGIQAMTYINEGNLYRLITKSDMPDAEKFEKWVFDEVLPQIRRSGSYSIQPAIVIPEDPLEQVLFLTEKLGETARLAIEYRNRNTVLTKTVEEQQPKVEAYNAFMDCDGNCSLEETAKAIGMGRNRMTEQLREKQIFYKKFANGDNHIYQEFIDRGYFKVKMKVVDKGHGLSVPYPMIFTTPKGIEWLKMKVFSQSVAL